MLSEALLAANLDALQRAQGSCPTLTALPPSLRVAAHHDTLVLEAECEADSGAQHWATIDARGVELGTAVIGSGSHAAIEAAGQAIVVGVGLGFAIERLARMDVRKVVAIEPEPGIATLLLSRCDWTLWFAQGRLRLLTGPDYRGFADAGRFLDGLRGVPILAHPLRTLRHSRSMTQARGIADRIVESARANGEARRKFAGLYLRQTLANLPAIARAADIAALAGVCAGTPAVVIGAGPSLDRNVEELRPLQDRAVIIAADTALSPLLSSGIRPHLVVAVDASALNARHLTHHPATDGILLAAEGSVHPSAHERFAGRTFVFRVAPHDPWPWLGTAGITRGVLRTWGSVLTSAFDLARTMGCQPILFAGADLAFTDRRPYCRGTIYDGMWQEWIDRGCTWDQMMDEYFSRQVERWPLDIRGQPTRSSPSLLAFRDWLVDEMRPGACAASHAPRDTGIFINATGAGILHGPGIVQASLHSILASAPPRPHLRAMLEERHRRAARESKDRKRLSALVSASRRKHDQLPIDRWIAFTADTVSREEIVGALGVTDGMQTI